MLPFFIIYALVGIACITVGLLVWKKGKVSLMHGYHLIGVEDKKAYGEASGKALFGLGVFLIVLGAASLPEGVSPEALNFATILGIIAYVFCMTRIQKKYSKKEL